MDLIKHFNEVATYERITDPKEERELIAIAQRKLPQNATKKQKKVVIEARNKIIISNLLWVAKIAKKYASNASFAKTNRYSSLEDLYGHGISGLYEAINRFDLNYRTSAGKPVRFITYATWYIHRALLDVMYGRGKSYLEYSMIRTPISATKSLGLLHQAEESHFTSTGKNISDEELAKVLKISLKTVDDFHKMRAARFCLSDAKLRWEHKPENKVFDRKLLKKALRILNDRQKYVISQYFGIGCEPKVLTEIAANLKVSKQLISQTKNIAIESIKEYLKEKCISQEDFYETT